MIEGYGKDNPQAGLAGRFDPYAEMARAVKSSTLLAAPYGVSSPRESHRALLEQSVQNNIEFGRELAARVEKLANISVGQAPANSIAEPKEQAGLGGNGLLDMLRSAASEQRRVLHRLADALSRMEADLV